ncbi:large conductance mechanosensitive channel [Micrococcales bacterium KH10]|nr:large conductance mechanosensitive channel [Micrococcales bacterium KH10]
MKNVFEGFKEFISRGNAVDLAVGVVIGAAFSAVIDALVKGVLTPIIAALFGQPNLDSVGQFTLNNAAFYPGAVLTALINFLLVAAALYFFVVLPLNKLAERRAAKQDAPVEDATEKAEDVVLLEQIRDLLAAKNSGGNTPPPPLP